MAPEVIMNIGHGRAADWYTLGILLYELTVGRPPFMHDDTFELLKIILRDSIEFSSSYHSDAKSLIRHLTMHDLSKRFGNLIGGAQDVKNHRYFSKIDFTAIINMAWHDVPYIPPPPRISLETLRDSQSFELS